MRRKPVTFYWKLTKCFYVAFGSTVLTGETWDYGVKGTLTSLTFHGSLHKPQVRGIISLATTGGRKSRTTLNMK